jgi:hypothetical protein
MLTTAQLAQHRVDTLVNDGGDIVYLLCKSWQGDGSCFLQFEHSDESGQRYGVHVASADVHEPRWELV